MSALEDTHADELWEPAVSADELRAAGKLTVEVSGRQLLLLWNDGAPRAMDDTCIHKQRSLSEGVLLNGRIVCPGHQWAFDLETGYCAAREKYQPTHPARVVGDQVEVVLRGEPS